jgi:hypothetical protein
VIQGGLLDHRLGQLPALGTHADGIAHDRVLARRARAEEEAHGEKRDSDDGPHHGTVRRWKV